MAAGGLVASAAAGITTAGNFLGAPSSVTTAGNPVCLRPPRTAQYTIKTTIGPAASKDARNRREPMTVFGTDERDSAERREQKAKSLVGGGHRVVL